MNLPAKNDPWAEDMDNILGWAGCRKNINAVMCSNPTFEFIQNELRLFVFDLERTNILFL